MENKMQEEEMKNKIKQAQKELCYKSLAYCCGLEKPCSHRDKALKALCLDKEDYKMLKEFLDNLLAVYIRKKGGAR